MPSMRIEPRHLRTGMTKKERERNNESQGKVKNAHLKENG